MAQQEVDDVPGPATDDEEEEEQDWSDWEGSEGQEPAQSLFSSKVLPSPEAAFAHDKEHHDFDLREFARKVRKRSSRSLSRAIRI
jgi:hypothetical protein